MAQKLYITKGISGSGKSTWAKEQVDKSQGSTVIICKDDLRGMFWNGGYSRGREALVKQARNILITLALSEGKNVIVADTNFDTHEQQIREVVAEFSKSTGKRVEVFIQDFTDVPLELCIERDAKRANSLGSKVIKDQWKRWIQKPFTPIVQDKSLPSSVVFDVDGTLADMCDRSPYDWLKVGGDTVHEPVAELARTLKSAGYTILIVSGRDAVCRAITEQWLKDNQIPYDDIFMREENDNRKDNIVKIEIFENFIEDKYNILFWVDDRNQVVEALRNIGIKVFQVAEGDF